MMPPRRWSKPGPTADRRDKVQTYREIGNRFAAFYGDVGVRDEEHIRRSEAHRALYSVLNSSGNGATGTLHPHEGRFGQIWALTLPK